MLAGEMDGGPTINVEILMILGPDETSQKATEV